MHEIHPPHNWNPLKVGNWYKRHVTAAPIFAIIRVTVPVEWFIRSV
jgi:hypothetical protein